MGRRIASLARALFRQSQVEREMAEEMRFHIEERADHLVREGMARRQALRQARIEFGATEAYKEECRESRIAPWMEELWRNLRYAGRSLHRRPGFSLIAVLSLALGIGANLAVFSLLDRLVFAELPVRDPKSLYKVMTSRGVIDRLSYPKFERLRDNFDIFESLFGWTWGNYETTFENRTRTLDVAKVTGNYFDALGVRPALGRLLLPEDDRLGSAQAVVLSDRLWREFFGADKDVLGRGVKLRDVSFQIVGVAPPDFFGVEPGSRPDAYLAHHAEWRFNSDYKPGEGGMGFYTMGRLKQDVPFDAAATLLRERWPELLLKELGPSNYNSETEYLLLEDGSAGYSPLRDEFSQPLYALMGLAVAVFLIACANLASLLVVRGIERAGETGMRLALGAGRGQLVGQWMTECLLLAGIGGTAGLLLAYWITEGLLLFVEESDRAWLRFQSDAGALALGLGLTLAAGLLFGLLPALRASRLGTQGLIKEYSSSVVGQRGRLAQIVLCAQVAIALVLVTSAALFVRTMWHLEHTPAGVEKDAIAHGYAFFWKTDLPMNKRSEVVKEVLQRLRHSPNIVSASMGSNLPFVSNGRSWSWIKVAGNTPSRDQLNLAFLKRVAPEYFKTLGIPLLAGRDFQENDQVEDAPRVAIVSEGFARHYFPDRNPLGQEFERNGSRPRIIGVVGDTKDGSLREEPKEIVYQPVSLRGYPQFVVRAKPGVDASVCEGEIRAAMASLAPTVPIETGTLKEAVHESLGRDRLVAQLSSAFGVLGMLLAAVGLYGATAHMARSRRREIGLRIALGAQRSDIVRLMLQENVWVTVVGIAAGLAAAFAVGQVIESLLFGVKATDPLALGVSAGLLALTVLVASLWPALRASRVSPLESLRYE